VKNVYSFEITSVTSQIKFTLIQEPDSTGVNFQNYIGRRHRFLFI